MNSTRGAKAALRAEVDAWLAETTPARTSPFVNLKSSLKMTRANDARSWAREAGFPAISVGGRLLCRRADFERAKAEYVAKRRALGLDEDEELDEYVGAAPPMEVLLDLLTE